jgi:predicted nucleotidyltransferase
LIVLWRQKADLKTGQLQQICKKYNVKELYLFGSATTDDFSEDSDLDFIFKFNRSGFEGAFDQFIDLSRSSSKSMVGQLIYIILKSSEIPFFRKKSNAPNSCFMPHKTRKLLLDISLSCQ